MNIVGPGRFINTVRDMEQFAAVTQHDRAILEIGKGLSRAISGVRDTAAPFSDARRAVALLDEARTRLDDVLERGWAQQASGDAQWSQHVFGGSELDDVASLLAQADDEIARVPELSVIDAGSSTLPLQGDARTAALEGAALVQPSTDVSALPDAIKPWVEVQPGATQAAVRGIARAVGRHLMGVEYHGVENIPRSGAALVLGSHASYADPIFVGAGIRRPFHAMAAKEITKLMGPLARPNGVFTVDRAGGAASRPAVEIARGLLDRGRVVHMYPEGGIRRLPNSLAEPRAGAAALALETGAPVVPGASYGLQPGWARVPGGSGRHILYGEPIVFPRIERPLAEQVREAREVIHQRMIELHREAQDLYLQSGR
ncbi:MAG: 1-acyl-sn-glycerol-3-phosphate acyltransferase [Thermoleophilia bacterium]|nr:1-acyl-sn-glycerol-3-phosphate acyltransferase [Thermoleophilia bacterium]